MLLCPRIFVTFCKTEIHDVNVMLSAADTNQIVVGLDISMQEVPFTDENPLPK
jgi:hypothetical protein